MRLSLDFLKMASDSGFFSWELSELGEPTYKTHDSTVGLYFRVELQPNPLNLRSQIPLGLLFYVTTEGIVGALPQERLIWQPDLVNKYDEEADEEEARQNLSKWMSSPEGLLFLREVSRDTRILNTLNGVWEKVNSLSPLKFTWELGEIQGIEHYGEKTSAIHFVIWISPNPINLEPLKLNLDPLEVWCSADIQGVQDSVNIYEAGNVSVEREFLEWRGTPQAEQLFREVSQDPRIVGPLNVAWERFYRTKEE